MICGLRPSYYLNTLGLSWVTMIKTRKIGIELILEPEIFIFFEKVERG